ncbi:hypothetical protein HDF13_001572 [Edaphobacter lichenicola]|uniref:Uncharacterized protein n=1 Tax=Tunturiibacter gelidiferens TaxID=3069689 RepID=A0ACC5NXF9_9BACT|nr:hypothetical protein [Edaphobacter lichenicola]
MKNSCQRRKQDHTLLLPVGVGSVPLRLGERPSNMLKLFSIAGCSRYQTANHNGI